MHPVFLGLNDTEGEAVKSRFFILKRGVFMEAYKIRIIQITCLFIALLCVFIPFRRKGISYKKILLFIFVTFGIAGIGVLILYILNHFGILINNDLISLIKVAFIVTGIMVALKYVIK